MGVEEPTSVDVESRISCWRKGTSTLPSVILRTAVKWWIILSIGIVQGAVASRS
jgi:hypothetical protein